MEKILMKISDLIQELNIKKQADANRYEACETVARLAPAEVVDLINDQELKEGIKWLKNVHGKIPDVAQWRSSFAITIHSLFNEAGGIKK
ncbi:MAG: hypothetical protein QW358_04720 [Candidatus Hadarchaeum sp.]